MAYRMLDMAAYARLDEYNYFRTLAYPYVGVTVQVDITPLRARVRAEGLPFFLSLLYVTSRAANSIPEMRQRLRGDGIAEYDLCPTSHTVSLGDGATATACSAQTAHLKPFSPRQCRRRRTPNARHP